MTMFEGIGNALKGAGSAIFGDTPGVPSYETLKRRREIADMLMQRTMQTSANSVGGGLGQLAQALAYRIMDEKLSGQERGERDRIASILSGMGGGGSGGFNGGFTGGGTASPGGPVDAVPTGPVSGSAPSGDMAAMLRQEMTAKGLPEHVADGFLMNFQDESGLNPGINEQNPTVPGSRGGFGLAQWTGPRRKALESYAAQSGRDVADPRMQIEFMLSELQGSEAGAAQSIMAAPDAGSAAAAIAKNYLRPAEQHLQRRVADYTGGGGLDLSSMLGGREPDMGQVSQLAEVMSNPYASEGQKLVAKAMIERQMGGGQGITPYQAAQLGMDQQRFAWEKERYAQDQAMEQQRLERDSRGEYGLQPVWGTDAQGNPALVQLGRDGQPVQPAMPEGFAISNKPIEVDAGTMTILLDPQTRQPIAQIPKNQREAAAETAIGKAQGEAIGTAQTGLPGADAKAQQAVDLIQSIANDPALPSITGMMQGRLPPMSQAGTDLNVKIEQLQGKVFLDAFESLKGGGAITELEGLKAEQAMARLNRAQSDEEFRGALTELQGIIAGGVQRMRQRAGQAMPAEPAAPAALGSPDDAALFQKYGLQ